jgi:hypothetical protein
MNVRLIYKLIYKQETSQWANWKKKSSGSQLSIYVYGISLLTFFSLLQYQFVSLHLLRIQISTRQLTNCQSENPSPIKIVSIVKGDAIQLKLDWALVEHQLTTECNENRKATPHSLPKKPQNFSSPCFKAKSFLRVCETEWSFAALLEAKNVMEF